MKSLTEAAERILSELEEAGEQNIYAMLNTIIDPNGLSEQVNEFQEALRTLHQTGYITMGMEEFSPRIQQELPYAECSALIDDVKSWMTFDKADHLWSPSKGDYRTSQYPVIFVTPTGKAKAFEILDRRGYQWWRAKE